MTTSEWYITLAVKIIAIYDALKFHKIKCMNSCDTGGSINSNDCFGKLLLSYIIGNVMNIVECLLCSIYFPKFTNIIW